MSINYLGAEAGPGYDIEVNYLRRPHLTLPNPAGFPFDKQGMPIYFDQPHISPLDVAVATKTMSTNPLPYGHFIGVGINGAPPRQINQPDFLSISEDIYLQ